MQKSRILDSSNRKIIVLLFSIFLVSQSGMAAEAYPQLKLPVKKISFCGLDYIAWVAKTDKDRQRGLMGFRPLKKKEAMLFLFEESEPRNFWMKNVPYDLDIAFFSSDKKLVSFMTMKGTSPMVNELALPTYSSEEAAQYAVEVAGSTLKNLKKKCSLSFN